MSVISFTGHRFLAHPDNVRTNLRNLLSRERGFSERSGIVGGALGVDTIAAEVLYELDLPYKLYAPCHNQDKLWNRDDRERYRLVLERAQSVRYIHDGDYPGAYVLFQRNEAMIDDSDVLTAVFDGRKKGGTYHAVSYAKRIGRTLVELHPDKLYTFAQENP